MESAQQQENQRIPLLFEPDKELNARKEKSYLDCLKKTKTQRKCCKDQLIIQSISIMKSIGFKRKAKNGNKFFTKTEILKKTTYLGSIFGKLFFFEQQPNSLFKEVVMNVFLLRIGTTLVERFFSKSWSKKLRIFLFKKKNNHYFDEMKIWVHKFQRYDTVETKVGFNHRILGMVG